MSIYAIGDVHGAARTLDRLLARIEADNASRLWFVGDLVNRGPDSAGVLRRVRDLGERAVTILGNHDLALLALAHRPDVHERANASLRDLLNAPDRDALLEWLRGRPLVHSDAALGWTMVHAGIPREWTVEETHVRAGELEEALRGADHVNCLAQLLGDAPSRWDDGLEGIDRLRYIANALTRQRFVHGDGRLDMNYKKTLTNAPDGLTPWFKMPERASARRCIVFGHWSALEQVAWPEYRSWGIDTGAAWGGSLSALRIDEYPPTLVSVENAE